MGVNSKIHVGLLWSMIVAAYPIAVWLDSRYAYAEDVERSDSRIILEVQQNYIDSRKEINQLRIDRFTDMLESGKELRPEQDVQFKSLQKERHIYMRQEAELDRLRQEIE